MKVVCPECQSQFPVTAGFADRDGKALAIALAGMDAALGRATVNYLALHKPLKTQLRIAKAAKIAEEIAALASSGEVRRNGVTRRASAAMWAQGIETMIDQRDKLRLPLSGHGYLLEVVFGIADSADAVAERKTEAQRRVGNRAPAPSANVDPKREQIAWLRTQVQYGALTQAEFEVRIAELEATP